MAEVKWVRVATDIFDNPKIKYLRSLAKGDTLVLLWLWLIARAGKCNAGGRVYIAEGTPYSPALIASEIGAKAPTVRQGLDAMEQLNMIERTAGGEIRIIGWEEHQNASGMDKIREKDRERKRAKRAKDKSEDSTDISASVRGLSVESPDTEKEEEKEYIHSIILSGARENENPEMSADESQRIRAVRGKLGQGLVLLSEEQNADLLERLSLEEYDKYIGIIAECERKGKCFKSKTHYQAILDMVEKDRRITQRKIGGTV